MNTFVVAEAERLFEHIEDSDLAKLCEIAIHDSEEFAARYPKYQAAVVCIALCQGAALHYVDGRHGVKDFDVWTFYASGETPAFPVRRRRSRDFEESKFGKHSGDTRLVGRRVDLLGRSIEHRSHCVFSRQAYLRDARTRTAGKLSEKPVVLVYPAALRGQVVWPVSDKARQ